MWVRISDSRSEAKVPTLLVRSVQDLCTPTTPTTASRLLSANPFLPTRRLFPNFEAQLPWGKVERNSGTSVI